MTSPSPLLQRDVDSGGVVLPWGGGDDVIDVVDTFGDPAIEYAAVRRGCAVIDESQRGLVELTGDDRLAFLDRMLTAPLKGLGMFGSAASFWLNRKGRIDADVVVTNLGDRVICEMDAHSVGGFIESLGSFVIMDDVEMQDRSGNMHKIALHGPSAAKLLSAASEAIEGASPEELDQGHAAIVRIGGARGVVTRRDTTGETGIGLWVASQDAVAVVDAMLSASEASGVDAVRRAGWAAFNIARIEAGSPLFRVDFGSDSLPHETGVVADRVSFSKGCYLGQEIVARMQSLGGPKQTIRAIEPSGSQTEPLESGDQLLVASEDGGDPKSAGVVTSSTLSPMLSGKPIALAMVRSAHAEPGSELQTADGGTWRVREELAFWKRD